MAGNSLKQINDDLLFDMVYFELEVQYISAVGL